MVNSEISDLLESLDRQRFFLTCTTRDLTDAQASQRPTASELCLGGLIKHVAATEQRWLGFAMNDPDAGLSQDTDYAKREQEFAMLPGDTLDGVLAAYREVADRTRQFLSTEPDLNQAYPLPSAPWFEPGATWSVRRVMLHVIGETAQHAGHADILRETLDGLKTMG
jgi:uncharacterized damage-inducible protein DinB